MTTTPVMSITDEQIAEIEEAAKRATQGQWEVADGHYPSFKEIKGPSFNVSIVVSATDLDFKDYMARTADAEHIAAANPTAILSLISRLRAAEKDAERYRWLRDKSSMPGVLSSDSNAAKYFNEYMLCGDQMDKVIDAVMEQSK